MACRARELRWPRCLRALGGVLFGQLVSLLLVAGGTCAVWLKTRGVDAPTLMSTLNYILLSGFLLAPRGWLCQRVSELLRRRQAGGGPPPSLLPSRPVVKRINARSSAASTSADASSHVAAAPPPPIPHRCTGWWKYAIVALIDVEANYCVVKAYQFTSLTSVMLLDAFTIPCVMVLSRCVFRKRYGWAELVGVAFALGGLSCNVLSDVVPALGGAAAAGEGSPARAPIPWLGDVLVLFGSMLYAASNVAEEYFVKNGDRAHYLGMLGLFGSVISVVQLAILEREQVATLVVELSRGGQQLELIAAIAGFALSLFLMYTTTALFLSAFDSTLFNLSILTSDVGAVIASALFFHQRAPPLLYFAGLALIVVGVSLYSTRRGGGGGDDDDNDDEHKQAVAAAGVAMATEVVPPLDDDTRT